MCLAIPEKIKKINGRFAQLENGRKVNIDLIENPQEGEYLLVHADLAINKLEPAEAKKILKLVSCCAHQH